MLELRTAQSIRVPAEKRSWPVTRRLSLWVLVTLGTAAPGLAYDEAIPLARFRHADEPQVSERVIEQGEWASELAFSLGLSDALPVDLDPEDRVGLLCPEQAERSLQLGGISRPSAAPFRVVVDAPPTQNLGDPIRMVVTLPATSLYVLSVSGLGPQRWAIDQRTVGHLDPSPLGFAQASPVLPLLAGPHELTAYLGHASRVDRVELNAYRPLCIAPADGWHMDRLLTFASSARTLVRALGLERWLPVEGEPVSLEPDPADREATLSSESSDGPAFVTAAFREVGYRAQIATPGVFTLLVQVYGRGDAIWSIDGRYRVTVRRTSDGFQEWMHVATLQLDSGEHAIRARLPRGTGVDRLYLIPRRSEDVDYIEILEAAGFRNGVPDQPVTHTDAYRNLSNPLFTENSSHFLERLTSRGGAAPWWVRKAELDSISKALAANRE